MTGTTTNEKWYVKYDVKFFVALIVAAAYLIIWGLLLHEFGFGGKPFFSLAGGNWDRAIGLFNSLSAIGAAAVGVLLGTKVEQVKVEEAKKNTEAAKKETETAKTGTVEAKGALEDLLKAAQKVSFKPAALNIRPDDSGVRENAQEELHQAMVKAARVLGR